MAMDVKGITWAGNIFQKIEDIYVEVEDLVFEETVKYIGNQMQTIGESVKKIYSDVMQDILPPCSYVLDETSASELPKRSFQGSKKITVKADTNQTTKDSRIDRDVDNDVIHAESFDSDVLFISGSRNFVKGEKIILHESMLASKTVNAITLSKTDTCITSQSRELLHVNQNHAATVSKPASAEDTTNEIEDASTEEIPNVEVLAESAEKKERHSSSYSSTVLFGDQHGITMDSTFQPDNYSYHVIILSHPETWDFNVPKIGTVVNQGHETTKQTTKQDDELKLEETCVMVTRDELHSAPNAGDNLVTTKNKKWHLFSLSKKVSRKQEYEEVAILHGSNEKGKGECAENLGPTLRNDHKKLPLPDTSETECDTSETEWELL